MNASKFDPSLRPDPAITWQAMYVISAKSLQAYVMAGGKLREMTGATLLIDELPRSLLETVLSQCGLRKDKDWWPVTQASGIARLLMREVADACRLFRLMPAIAAEFAPELELVQAWLPLTDQRSYPVVSAELERQMLAARNAPSPGLPSVGPPGVSNPRTGKPAIAVDLGARVDHAAMRKRQRRRAHHQLVRAQNFSDLSNAGTFQAFGFGKTGRERIARHFGELAGEPVQDFPPESAPEGSIPDAGAEALAYSERGFIGVLHADGNGLGEMFINLGEALKDSAFASVSLAEMASLYAAMSRAIDHATHAALEQSSGPMLDDWIREADATEAAAKAEGRRPRYNPLPVWPIVAAGDDLSALFRADVVEKFVRLYINAFAQCTACVLADVKAAYPWAKDILPDRLTSGAGAVLCHSHYPFRTAYALCESLASHAKRTAKRHHESAGSVAFHRLIGAAHVTEWDQLTESVLLGPNNRRLSQAPYFIGVDKDGHPVKEPTLASLRALADAIKELSKGPVRQLLTYLRTDLTEAERHWQRMKQVSDPKLWTNFCEALARLTGKASDAGFNILFDAQHRTPFADALALLESESKPQ